MSVNPLTSGAASYQWQPSVSTRTQYDDNLTQLSNNPVSTSTWVVNAASAFEIATAVSRLTIDGQLIGRRYSTDRRFNSDDLFFDGQLEHTTPKLRWAIAFNRTENTSLTSEIDTSGLVGSGVDRKSWQLSPQITYQWNEKTSTFLQATTNKVRYIDAEFSGLQGYNFATGTLGINYSPSRKHSAQLSVGVTDYQAVVTNLVTTTTNASLSWLFTLTPNWTLQAGSGIEFTRIKQPFSFLSDSKERGQSYDFSAEHQGLTSSYTFSFNRALSPSGSGVLLTRDDYQFSSKHQINPRWSINTAARQLVNENFTGSNNLSKRTYSEFKIDNNWQVSKNLVTRLGYTFGHQDSQNQTGTVRRNRISLTISYQPQAKRISR